MVYEYNEIVDTGILSFTLRHRRTDTNQYQVLDFPLGNLDVFLNGRSLVKNLDYWVDFPRIVITNKEYLDSPDTKPQKVVIRMSGFCTTDFKFVQDDDVGFVQYGTLSYNNRFDIRDDKINRIIVGGALYHKSELQFGEDDFDIKVIDSKNGAPYVIRDVFVPINSYIDAQTGQYVDPSFQLKEQAEIIDKKISDYLTVKIPEKDTSLPNAIPDLYLIYSPFFGKIIKDLETGVLNDPMFSQHYGDDWVISKLESYIELLKFDAIQADKHPDTRYVKIHPHIYSNYVELDILKFKFLTKAVAIYGNDLIDLSSFVKIKAM